MPLHLFFPIGSNTCAAFNERYCTYDKAAAWTNMSTIYNLVSHTY